MRYGEQKRQTIGREKLRWPLLLFLSVSNIRQWSENEDRPPKRGNPCKRVQNVS